jgi:hypothetical protein
VTNHAEWDAQTKEITKNLKSYAQRQTYPSKDSNSYIEPYVVRDHAWNIDGEDNSNDATWHQHTLDNTKGYYDQSIHGPDSIIGAVNAARAAANSTTNSTQSSFVQRNTYPSKDSKSYIEPYVIRDHAWNIDGEDNSNDQSWRDHTIKNTVGYYDQSVHGPNSIIGAVNAANAATNNTSSLM